MGPFKVLHQPLSLSVAAWAFWAVCSLAEAYVLVYALDRGMSERPPAVLAGSVA